MHMSLATKLLAVGLLSCSDLPCVALPCPLPLAIEIVLNANNSTAAIPGAFVQVGGNTVPCTQGSATACLIAGTSGAYELDIGAPGFQTVHRSVQVSGTSAGCGTCGSVDTQHLTVTLIPAS
jgi:hypothetical protein